MKDALWRNVSPGVSTCLDDTEQNVAIHLRQRQKRGVNCRVKLDQRIKERFVKGTETRRMILEKAPHAGTFPTQCVLMLDFDQAQTP